MHARRALGYRFVEHSAARWAMFAGTIADPGALAPEDARLLLDASGDGHRIGDGVRQAFEADLRDDLAAAVERLLAALEPVDGAPGRPLT